MGAWWFASQTRNTKNTAIFVIALFDKALCQTNGDSYYDSRNMSFVWHNKDSSGQHVMQSSEL